MDLAATFAAFASECRAIEAEFDSTSSSLLVMNSVHPTAPTEDGCLVALWDCWQRFLRDLMMQSAGGEVSGTSGAVYLPTLLRNENEVLAHLKASRSRLGLHLTAGEPKWFAASALSSIAAELGLQNGSVIAFAVGASSTIITLNGANVSIADPMEEIRLCRNFVAHKSPTLLEEVRQACGMVVPDLRTLMRSRRFGLTRFSEWVESCLVIGEAACH